VNDNAGKEDKRNEERQKKIYLRVSFGRSARHSMVLYPMLLRQII